MEKGHLETSCLEFYCILWCSFLVFLGRTLASVESP